MSHDERRVACPQNGWIIPHDADCAKMIWTRQSNLEVQLTREPACSCQRCNCMVTEDD